MRDMDDLVTWLRAQLDARERELAEDERVAWAAAAEDTPPWHRVEQRPPDPPWKAEPETGQIKSAEGYTVVHFEDSTPSWKTADHIVRWDPDRVLARVATERAEVDAKRQRIEHYLKIREYADPTKHPAMEYVLAEGAVGRSLKLDALPYAERDGYREEWRP